MPDPFDWLDDALADLDRRGLRRTLAARTILTHADLEHATPERGSRIEINGQSLINFGSNDYLGLASDPRIAAAAKSAVDQFGWGAGASPLVTGRTALHAALESQIARFMATEAAILFSTGYAANLGAITSLVGKGDAVFSDELNHASIIDGCRLSGAKTHIYRHGDLSHLRDHLSTATDFRRRLIVSESLFSMSGDFAPLGDLAALATRHHAMLMIDEAHALGIFGAHGRGLCEQTRSEPSASVRVGTLSKALGSAGGFIAGSQRLIDWIANRARSYVFSTSMPAASAASAGAAIDIVQAEPARRKNLLSAAACLRDRLETSGIPTHRSESQIVSVIFGDPFRAVAASASLREQGFFVPAIRPPSVPDGQSLLRISLTCLHTKQQIDDLVAALITTTK